MCWQRRCRYRRRHTVSPDFAQGFLQLVWVICLPWMAWLLFVVVLNTTTPMIVFLSGSSGCAPKRYDVFVLNNNTPEMDVGDLVPFQIEGRAFLITHRIIQSMQAHNVSASVEAYQGEDFYRTTKEPRRYLTKGDDNRVDDRGLYGFGKMWVYRREILGRLIFRIPVLGLLPILLDDYPILHYFCCSYLVLRIMLQCSCRCTSSATTGIKRRSWALSTLLFVGILLRPSVG